MEEPIRAVARLWPVVGRGGRGVLGGASDEDLIKAACEGSDQAFGALVVRHKRLILTACASVAGDHHGRDDQFSQALVDLWKGVCTYGGQAKVTTWMFTVCRNAASRLGQRSSRVRLGEVSVTADEFRSLPGSGSNPADIADVAAVGEALRKLPQAQREAILLQASGHSIEEISEIQICSEGAVKSRISRGRDLLLRLLSDPDVA